jgi:hypothetical protein
VKKIEAHYDTQQLKYDFASITHYAKYEGALNEHMAVIVPLHPYEARVIGQRDALSALDVARIKKAYKCALNSVDMDANKPDIITPTTSVSVHSDTMYKSDGTAPDIWSHGIVKYSINVNDFEGSVYIYEIIILVK